MQPVTRVLLCLALCACTKKISGVDVNPLDDIATSLSLSLGQCHVTLVDTAFDFDAVASTAGQLTLEALRPDGSSVVIERRTMLQDQLTPLRIPADALTPGQNIVILSLYGLDLTPTSLRFTLDARVPVAGASAEDLDGDCYSPLQGDCDDGRSGAHIHPGAQEKCTNRMDDNCDGLIDFADPSCTLLCEDADADGFGAARCGGPDCDDADALRNPMATERCNGIDDNCNGKIDESFDADHDGFVSCTPEQGGLVTWRVAGAGCSVARADCSDCNDSDATVFPGAFEPCDAVLHDCGGPGNKLADDDGDGAVNCADPDSDNDAICDAGSPPALQKPCASPNVSDGRCCGFGPGNLPDNCKGARNYWQTDRDRDGIGDACDTCSDLDGDGYGQGGSYDRNHDLAAVGAAISHPPGAPSGDANTFDRTQCVSPAADCRDDGTAQGRAAFPGNLEVCDGIDNNCDGNVDEGFNVDGDAYTLCQGDCDDTRASVNPGVVGDVCNGLDDNCNGRWDEDADLDGDTYTSCGLIRANGQSGGVDCDDTRNTVFPGANEACNNRDDNCNGQTDEGFDGDNDGVTTCGGDCNDNAAGIRPGATEICDNVDNNCNGQVDEGCDDDNDNYCEKGMIVVGNPATCTLTGPAGPFDCNDTGILGAAVNPGAPELPCDGIDNNCDGSIDEGSDADNDGYLNCPGATWWRNGSTCPSGGTCVDCNDEFASAHPGASEICFNGIDDDCDGIAQDASDPNCCTSVDAIPFINAAATATTFSLEDFESYEDFAQVADLGENAGDSVVNFGPNASNPSPTNTLLRGWERKDLGDYCDDGYDTGSSTPGGADISIRIRNKTLFELQNLPLGSKTAGTYGNGGAFSWTTSAPDGCTIGVGCFENAALTSPLVKFTAVAAPTGNDVALVEYHRFASHTTTGGTAPGPTGKRMCDVGGGRCDTCLDGEYVNLLRADGNLVTTSVTSPPASYSIDCFTEPTFQNASEAPSWVPATHVNCPLSAQARDYQKWRLVYGTIGPWPAENRRVLFRFNTFNNNGAINADDGVYYDDIRFLVCRRP